VSYAAAAPVAYAAAPAVPAYSYAAAPAAAYSYAAAPAAYSAALPVYGGANAYGTYGAPLAAQIAY
jgi:hypothetical protein